MPHESIPRTKLPTRWAIFASLLLLLGFATPSAVPAQGEGGESADSGAVIRLLPTRDAVVSGKTLIETLLIEPKVHTAVFYVDGAEAGRAKLPPWTAKLKLASPAREQRIRVDALGPGNKVLGSDEMIVNRSVTPLRIDLEKIDRASDRLEVEAALSLPLEVELERIVVYLNETPHSSFRGDGWEGGAITATIPYSTVDDRDFVRVVAHLVDGRSIEDVELVTGAKFQEEIDVRLVQLQVLVTNKQGAALTGLKKEHFRIRDRGRNREPAGLFVADEVSLLLGLSIDSSGSMQAIWPETRRAAETFLETTVQTKDEAFVIDFDTQLNLLQGRTPDLAALRAALADLQPEGGTALYDSILYGLVQFDGQQGRRALVVITDGFDIDSRADPERTIEFGKKLGVPIYVIALENTGRRGPRIRPGAAGGGIGVRAGGLGSTAGGVAGTAEVQMLRVVTDPTGGRLLRVRTTEQLERAFQQINSDLRNHYILTYYTDNPPKPGEPPQVSIELDGFKNLEITTILGADQIY